MGLSDFKSEEMKGFRVRVGVKDYEVLEKIAASTGFTVDYLVRYLIHDEVVSFLDNHPDFKV